MEEHLKQKIYEAHFVRGVKPHDYRVKYLSIFELVQYRSHLQPDDIFITFYPENEEKISLTYSQFVDKVFRTANLLRSEGIGVEDRITTISHNHINTVIQYFAAWSLGATVVPINVSEETERIKYILESSRAKLAFVNHEYLDTLLEIQKNLPDLKSVYVHGVTEAGLEAPSLSVHIYEDEIVKQRSDFFPDESVTPETESLIVYTSGTTGLPKGVVLTQYNLLIDADGISKWHKIEKGDTMMCVLPIHHVNGTVVTLMTPFLSGAKVILNQKFHTHKFYNIISDEDVQVVSVVPTLLQFLCHDFENSEKPDKGGLKNFRHLICGAGPLTCELALKFEQMFGLKIMHGYGLSETTCYSCFLPIDNTDEDHIKWLRDFGFPSIGVEIEPNEMDIHNEKGEMAAEGERGEIVIRGHNVMKYYDNNEEANAKTFEFGWFRSGDEGFFKVSEKGRKYYFITGRIKELIIRGGVNIAPLEIDEVLMSIPEVEAGIAVGFDNDWYGEEVGALVHLKDGITASEEIKSSIINHCSKNLPFYKSPKTVIFTETIPVTSTGKYQRNKVKHLFSEFKTVQFKQEK